MTNETVQPTTEAWLHVRGKKPITIPLDALYIGPDQRDPFPTSITVRLERGSAPFALTGIHRDAHSGMVRPVYEQSGDET